LLLPLVGFNKRACRATLNDGTNPFSKKIENREAAIALHYMYYNFGRIHQSLRLMPAMEAGLQTRFGAWKKL